jgi:glycosyltransferase involved in cell wall biosynthesis
LKDKKFLLIAYAYPPKDVVGALRPYRISKYMPAYGWVPEVITAKLPQEKERNNASKLSMPDGIRIHKVNNCDLFSFLKNNGSKTKKKILKSKHIALANKFQNEDLTYQKKAPKRLIDKIKGCLIGLVSTPDRQVFWGLSLLFYGVCLLLKKSVKFTLIITTSPPHSSQVFGCLLAKIFSKPHIMDLRDPWTDVYRGYKSKFRNCLEGRLEKWVISNSASVISCTEGYTQILQRRFPELPKSKFQTVTNSFEEDKFEVVPKIESKKFTIAYLGIFYPRRNPYCFFKALGIWLQRNAKYTDNIEFRIIGKCDPTTLAMIKRHNLEKIVRITGRLPHEKAIEMTKSADLLLLATGTGDDTPKGWVPSKLYEYMACGRPILANIPDGQASDIIKKTKSGFLIHKDDPDAIMKILDQEYLKKTGNEEKKDLLPFLQNRNEVFKYGNKYCIKRFVKIFESVV